MTAAQAPRYLDLDLPFASLPQCLRGQTLFLEVASSTVQQHDASSKGNNASKSNAPQDSTSASSNSSGCSGPSSRGSDFKFSKAVSGIGKGGDEPESSYTTRGDGKFEDGSSVKRQGNVVMLGPDALSPENAEATLQHLDQMAAIRPKPPPQQPPASSSFEPDMLAKMLGGAAQHQRPLPRSTASAYQSVHDAAKGVLFDLDESSISSRALPPAGARPAPLPEPTYSVSDLASDESGPAGLQVRVHLPSIESAGEAEVDIGATELRVSVPGACALRLKLPCAVDDRKSKAKWLKAKRELLLTLPKK